MKPTRTGPPSQPAVDVAELVLRWRTRQLERAGYPAEDAIEIAKRTDLDLHDAIELLRKGCPPKTALRILL